MISKKRSRVAIATAAATVTLSALLVAYISQLPLVIAQQHQTQPQQQSQVRQHPTATAPQKTQQQQQHAIPTTMLTNAHPNSQMKLKLKEQQLNKLQKYLNERQLQLVRENPGSLQAIARAIKMTILECQYQMRQEQWDCPTYAIYSAKPVDVFGKLMSRSFRETAFVHSLLSAALTHSIARACSDSRIQTCGRRFSMARDGGDSQDIEFAQQFAQQFMEATYEHSSSNSIQLFQHSGQQHREKPSASSLNAIPSGNAQQDSISSSNNLINNDETINQINPSSPALATPSFVAQQQNSLRREQHHSKYLNSQSSHQVEMRNSIREMIDAHNDELGRLVVLDNMRRNCKCHGVSGACTAQTCWLQLPNFRQVANELHQKFDQAIQLQSYYLSANVKSIPYPYESNNLYSSFAGKKSNKKRSSASYPTPVKSMGSLRSGGLLDANADLKQHSNSTTSNGNNKSHTSNNSNQRASKRHTNSHDSTNEQLASQDLENKFSNQTTITTTHHYFNNNTNKTLQIRRPVARSIVMETQRNWHNAVPTKQDLIYQLNSPDFCKKSDTYMIKGTKGRLCSENPNASDRCDKLCCGRGYKTEVREEKYNCECIFKYCCELDCKTCTRRKVIHKCL